MSKFRCPECGEETAARAVRVKQRIGRVYRRRECGACGQRFNTTERPTAEVDRVPNAVNAHVTEIIAHAVKLKSTLGQA